jgi:hemerythrin-like domain-containing protein
MEATNILMDEHRVIERVLNSLEGAALGLDAGQPIAGAFFVEAADFIKGFADGCHHLKEEGVLFPAMEAAGVPREGGPIGAMLADHEEGRRLTRAMRTAAERMIAGEQEQRDAIIENAMGYVRLLRQHIAKEEGVLFPMAARAIEPSIQEDLTAAFERVEHEETGDGVHGKYLAIADRLAKAAKG